MHVSFQQTNKQTGNPMSTHKKNRNTRMEELAIVLYSVWLIGFVTGVLLLLFGEKGSGSLAGIIMFVSVVAAIVTHTYA